MFIGRKTELEFLENKYREPGGQLIVLYGRRRVGKTETLHEFCKGKEHVFYSCRECTDRQQLSAFSNKVLQKNVPIMRYVKEFTDWEMAFSSVVDFPGEGKKILVIDEFPYMCRGNSSIPSILQNLWDGSLKDEDVMVILCGSAMSFIEKELLSEKNPLYGRATGIYKMTEMPFSDVCAFFPKYTFEEQITVYAVLGGIPHYLKQFSDQCSIEENIKKNILSKGSILYSEVEFLLRQELRETALYNTVIEAIALGNTKLNDIYTKTQIEKSKLSVYLKNLIDLEIVKREFSVSDKTKEQANSSKGLYRLTDNFFRFWYAFVFTSLSDLEAGDSDGVFQYVVQPSLHEFTAFVYEDLCREYIRRKNRRGEFPVRYSKVGRWWGKITRMIPEENGKEKKVSSEIEIDVMATDVHGKQMLLGECKYKNSRFDMTEYQKFCHKWQTDYLDDCRYYLFSKSGFADNVKQHIDNSKVVGITMEMLEREFTQREALMGGRYEQQK